MFLLRAVLLAVLSATAFAPQTHSGPALVAHHLVFENRTDKDSCSATAVAPHTLLTAAHCMIGTDVLNVDGKNTAILATIYDGQDHELIVVDAEFKFFLPIEQRPPYAGEHVRCFGFPGGRLEMVPRDGRFDVIDDELFVFVLPVYPGDSGAGILSDGNTVIAVVSLGDKRANAAAFPLSFTSDQLAHIK
jgi:V8-like Glu-specific endopeptidase